VAIITGEGRGFSAGNDLKYQAVGGAKDFMEMLKKTGKKPASMGFAGLTERYNVTTEEKNAVPLCLWCLALC
jgi:enoyl-CoA hydratase/carnithine racemase